MSSLLFQEGNNHQSLESLKPVVSLKNVVGGGGGGDFQRKRITAGES